MATVGYEISHFTKSNGTKSIRLRLSHDGKSKYFNSGIFVPCAAISRNGNIKDKRLINIRLYRDYDTQPKEGVNDLEYWQQMARLVYYARKVARISEHIYYYNCTNKESYMHGISNKPRTDLWGQSVESMRILEDFFSDKGQEYRGLARRIVTYMMKSRMCLAARHRNREYFEKMEKIIKTEYSDCYDVIEWNNPGVRAIMCDFELNSFYRRLVYKVGKWLRR